MKPKRNPVDWRSACGEQRLEPPGAPRAQLARTAGCGPACTVLWQGRAGDHSPYADSPIVSSSIGLA